MKILQLGASGQTGQILCRLLLDRGHLVNALVRRPDNFPIKHDALSLYRGSPQSKDDVLHALNECEAAASTLNVAMASGFPWARIISPKNLMSSSIANLAECMYELGVRRVVIMSSNGANESLRYVPWFYRTLVCISNLKTIFDDHSRQENILLQSNLDWTALRPVGLNDRVNSPDVTVSFDGDPKPNTFISRETVAQYIVMALEDNKHIRERPTLS